MRLVILENSPQVAEWSARYVLKKIKDFQPGPDKYFVLGLPTGDQPYFEIGIITLYYCEPVNQICKTGLFYNRINF